MPFIVVVTGALYGTRELGDGVLVRGVFTNNSGSFSVFPLHIICVPIRGRSIRTSVLLDISGGQFGHTMGEGQIGHRLHRTCQVRGRRLLRVLASGRRRLTVTFVCLSSRLASSTRVRRGVGVLLTHVDRGLM